VLILIDLNAGMQRKDIAVKYGINRDTVADTEKAWLERGYLSLYPMHGGGVERKLTQEACILIKSWATSEALNASQIRAKLAEKLSIDAGPRIIARALKQMGFVWKRTRCWLKKNETQPTLSKPQ
jgi:transposase